MLAENSDLALGAILDLPVPVHLLDEDVFTSDVVTNHDAVVKDVETQGVGRVRVGLSCPVVDAEADFDFDGHDVLRFYGLSLARIC